MKLIGIVGTNSDTSTNRKLLLFMKKHFEETVEIDVCEIADILAFDEPDDKKAPHEVQILSDKITNSDGVIIATPEYDHSIPAALKSVLEWLSYTTRPLIDKPVMIVGASHGSLGTSRAQAHLRQILDAPELKARILPGSEFYLGRSLEAFSQANDLLYADKVTELEGDFAEFLSFLKIKNEISRQNPEQTETKRQFVWEHIDGGMA
ncbi:NADPH-dependent FMN reductase [Lactococcus raffinolactis]|uniref:NADPH-dependent FMN reductase n=1 Tax=Pseudolactococcus raffinolactis TaxID=1366 RepID=UPI00110806FF|nr:NADPH-dependent FMN reductase [Lactococcus raffinolactis]TLQ16372.1 NAD(P)H-dependent oxidoreductase [Lactococcus raffinolactis]